MNETGNTTGVTETPEKTPEQMLREKYGKVYRIAITIPVDDENDKNVVYFFKRPSVGAYDRYVKTMSQIGPSKASKAFLLDCVTDESRAALTADLDEYPGIGLNVGGKLTELLGLTNATNLRML